MHNTHPRHTPYHRLLKSLACCLGGSLALLPTANQAQVTFQIDRITYLAGQVTIEFTDGRLLADPHLAYALDYSDAVGEPAIRLRQGCGPRATGASIFPPALLAFGLLLLPSAFQPPNPTL